MTTRADVVRAARAYIGMPFRHQGRGHPGGGRSAAIDCAGLLVCVGEDLGLRDRRGAAILRSDYADYGPQELNEFLQAECTNRLNYKGLETNIEKGDVVTLRAPNWVSHCGIISDFEQGGWGLIFAYPVRLRNAPRGQIVEVRLDERWARRVAGLFAWPGVDD